MLVWWVINVIMNDCVYVTDIMAGQMGQSSQAFAEKG